jgi:hypothetical protein
LICRGHDHGRLICHLYAARLGGATIFNRQVMRRGGPEGSIRARCPHIPIYNEFAVLRQYGCMIASNMSILPGQIPRRDIAHAATDNYGGDTVRAFGVRGRANLYGQGSGALSQAAAPRSPPLPAMPMPELTGVRQNLPEHADDKQPACLSSFMSQQTPGLDVPARPLSP